MYRKLPPLHSLAAFEAAARHGSFAKAAEELFLTNSAVSHRIRQLEEAVGARLFLRLNRSVVLTAAGQGFLGTVRDVLDRLQRGAATLDAAARTPLKVTAAPAFASHWLAERITHFQEANPDIDLEIQASSHLVNLRNREADVAIRFGHGRWDGCHVERLLEEELRPLCSPAYLAKTGAVAAAADLAGRTLLRNARLPWRPWFEAAGLAWPEPATGPYFSEVDLMLDAASFGAGVALAGRITAAPYLRDGRLVAVTDVVLRPRSAFFVLCLPEAIERDPVARFTAWIRDQAARDALPAA